MVSVIFDTNIYGELFKDNNGLELVRKIKRDTTFIIHNFKLIRNELRRAPKLLPLYDELVVNRVIEESKQIKDLAKAYFKEYKANGGNQGQKKMINDLKIVACASKLGCDLVFSNDQRTLKHPIAKKAYEIINLKKGYRTPWFHSYYILKKRYF